MFVAGSTSKVSEAMGTPIANVSIMLVSAFKRITQNVMARTIAYSVRIHQIKVADSLYCRCRRINRHIQVDVVECEVPAISPSETYHSFPPLSVGVSLFDTYQIISYFSPAIYMPPWPEASGEGLTKLKLTPWTVEIRNGSITVKMKKAFVGVDHVINRIVFWMYAGFGGERSGLEEKLARDLATEEIKYFSHDSGPDGSIWFRK
jgi:hypothetical protein